jgi:hypothetical protein
MTWLRLPTLSHPCGGGVEYLHRDPASRRRRRKGKSQIWDSKIWSRVPRDSDPTKTLRQGPAAYTKDRSVLSSERMPHKKQDRNCQTVINIWSRAPDGAGHQDLLTDWPSVAMWLWLWTLRAVQEFSRTWGVAVERRTKNEVIRDSSFGIHSWSRSEWLANQNQVSHSRRKTRKEDSRSRARMERVLGTHVLWAVVIDRD